MDILRIAALGTAGVLLGITVKGAKPEFALLVTVGAGLCILAGTVGKMQYLLGMLAQMKSYLPVDSSYLNTLLKMLGITYVGQFSAGICKDAGYSSIAGQIELFARLAVLAVSMPVLLALFRLTNLTSFKIDVLSFRKFSITAYLTFLSSFIGVRFDITRHGIHFSKSFLGYSPFYNLLINFVVTCFQVHNVRPPLGLFNP